MYDCAHSAITFNNLNLPTYDIHSKESREQMLMNFHMLAKSFIEISSKHIHKSQQQNERISKLRDRIACCKDKISQLEGLNQALVFVSPSHYPKKYKFDPEKNVSIFKEYLTKTKVNKLDMNAHYQVRHELEKLGEESKLQLSELNTFVSFLLGQLQGRKKSIFEKSLQQSKKNEQHSIGSIPSGIQYLDSLTVFNTCVNPYRKYEVTSNSIQRVKQKKKKEVEEIQKDEIIIDRELEDYKKPEFVAGSNRFVPEEKDLELPDFEMDLELEGIVNYDYGFNAVAGTPSSSENLQTKNVAQDPYASKPNGQPQSQSPSTQNNLPPPPPSNVSVPPSLSSLPPPPPPSNLPPPPPMAPTNQPPPPSALPPPPTSLPPPPSGSSISPPPISKTAPKPLGGGGGNRAALLQQIENPNPMARLRKVVTIEKGGIKPANQPSTANSHLSQPAPNGQGNQGEAASNLPPRQMSFMEALQAKIRSRFQALHPGDESQEEEED